MFSQCTYVVYVMTMVITVTSRTNGSLRNTSGYHHVAGLNLKMMCEVILCYGKIFNEVRFKNEWKFDLIFFFHKYK